MNENCALVPFPLRVGREDLRHGSARRCSGELAEPPKRSPFLWARERVSVGKRLDSTAAWRRFCFQRARPT